MKKIKGKQESTETLYLKMMGSSTYRKKIVVTDISCSEGEIRPEEGACE